MTMKSFDATNQEFTDNYKLLIGAILPRPIAVVSTLNEDGTNNVAPFSFFTAVSAKPMIVAFSPLIRSSDGKKKDTVINIEREKEFVISFVNGNITRQVNDTSTELGYGMDEFTYSGLTPIDSDVVGPKRIKESLVHYECRLRDIISYGETVGSGRIITGEVVRVHVADHIIKDGRIDTDLLDPIGRGAGMDWIKCDHRFVLERPTK